MRKPGRPFLVVHTDLFYLPQERGSNVKGVLLVIDSFTKWIEAVMLTSTTSEAVWQAFESECIFRYGAP